MAAALEAHLRFANRLRQTAIGADKPQIWQSAAFITGQPVAFTTGNRDLIGHPPFCRSGIPSLIMTRGDFIMPVHFALLLALASISATSAAQESNQDAESLAPASADRDEAAVAALEQAQTDSAREGEQVTRAGRESRRPRDPIDLIPLIRVVTPYQEPSNSAIGGYVRFYICDQRECGERQGLERLQPEPEARSYGSEHRNWLSRWLIGRTFSRFLTVKLSVGRPNISATTVLASSVLQSSRSAGESWNSEVNGRRFLTPYLRVDSATLVTVDIDLSASTQVQANISRAVMDVVGRAVALVEPTSQLVTSLNSNRFRQTSDFIDQSISTLFATSLVERASNQFGPNEWSNKVLAVIHVDFPMNRRVLRSTDYRNVGIWRVMATAPTVSIFSDVTMYPATPPTEQAAVAGKPTPPTDPNAIPALCDQSDAIEKQACWAFRRVSAQSVLELPVGENLTLGQALLADTNVAAESARLLANPNDGTIARRLCNLVATKAQGLGLNRYDAAATVWAFAQETQFSQDSRTKLLNETTSCPSAALAQRIKLGVS